MSDPATAFAAMSGGGGTLSAIGNLQAVDAKGKAVDVEARDMERQASIAQVASLENARMVRKTGERAIGAQQVAFAASGVDTTQGGTPLLVMANSAREVELQAIKTQFQGEIASTQLKKQAAALRYGQRITKRQGDLAAIGSILGGAGKGAMAFGGR